MSRDPQAGERGRWAQRMRRLALVAVLAIASSALLPLVHGEASHLAECGVCLAIAHSGTSVADAVPQADFPPPAALPDAGARQPDASLPRSDLELRSARAPPAISAVR